METGFFNPAMILQQENLPGGGPYRNKSAGDFAFFMEKASWGSPAASDLNFAGGRRTSFSSAYRQKIGAFPHEKKPVSPEGEEAGFMALTIPSGTVPVDRAEVSLPLQSVTGQEEQFPGEEGPEAAPAEGEEPGPMEEPALTGPISQVKDWLPAEGGTRAALSAGDVPDEAEKVKLRAGVFEETEIEGFALAGEDLQEPGREGFVLAKELSPEQEGAGVRTSFAGMEEDPLPGYKNTAETLSPPPVGTAPGDGDGSRQQEPHDVQLSAPLPAASLGEEPSPDTLSSGKGNPFEAETGVEAGAPGGAVVKEGDETAEIFVGRQAGSPGDGEAGEKEADGKTSDSMKALAGSGKKEETGGLPQKAVSAEAEKPVSALFSSVEAEEPVIFSLPDHEGIVASGAGEGQHIMPASFRSRAEIPVLTNFHGEIIPQIVEQAGRMAMTGAEELRLRLQPEFLGEVLIRVRRLQGVLTAEIITQDLAVRELLASQLEALRQRFQEVNLPVEHLSVSVQAEGEHGSASFAGDADGRASPGASGTGGGVEENASEKEGGVLPPTLWNTGQRVDYLA